MLVPFEFGQHAPVFSHLSAVFRQNTRGERGNGGGGGGGEEGATTRSLFSHPADGCMVSRLGVASRHKKVSWLLDLPLQRLGRNHAFSHSLGYSGESGAGSESILTTAESRGGQREYTQYSGESGADSESILTTAESRGGQREYTRSQKHKLYATDTK